MWFNRNTYTVTVNVGLGISSLTASGWTGTGTTTISKTYSYGDTVNLAARLEGTNKVYGTKAIISEAVYDKLLPAYRTLKESFSKRSWLEFIFNHRQYTAERDALKVVKSMMLSMTGDTMEQLNDRYDRFMTEQYHGRAITIDVDNLDFLNRREDFEYIIARIDERRAAVKAAYFNTWDSIFIRNFFT